MNEKQIRSIEKRFSMTLPDGYRALLLSPPTLLAAVLKADAKENPGQTPCFLEQRMLIGVNEFARNLEEEEPFEFDPNDEAKTWPEHYFVIGGDVGGNYFCVSTRSGSSRVYFWLQGDTVFTRYADDIPSFVRKLFRSYYAEIAAMDCD